jgi:hypothetical protein
MKYLKYFESFNMDDLLDKINATGINSLTSLEKDFMKAKSEGDEEKLQEIDIKSRAKVFKSSSGVFQFEFSGKIMEIDDDRTLYYGSITVPNIEWKNGNEIDGVLDGSIEYSDGEIILHFEKEAFGSTYDVFDFCNGLEYELDEFIQYIVDELNS